MYGKIFQEIFQSTIMADGGWLPTTIFEAMIVLSDKNGVLPYAPRALYRTLGLDVETEYSPAISYEQYLRAIEFLESPDPSSNSKTAEGRRIVHLTEIEGVDGNRGWLVVNKDLYLQKASKHDKRESTAERVAKFRASQRPDSEGVSIDVTQRNASTGHKDEDEDEDEDEDKNKPRARKRVSSVDSNNTKNHREVAHWLLRKIQLNNPHVQPENMERWATTIRLMMDKDGKTHEQIAAAMDVVTQDEFWMEVVVSADGLRRNIDKILAKVVRQVRNQRPRGEELT